MVMGDTHHYINAVTFLTSSIKLLGAKPIQNILSPFGYPPYLNYYNYQPNLGNAQLIEVFSPDIILHQGMNANCVGCSPAVVSTSQRTLPPKPIGPHATLIYPLKKSAKPTEQIEASRNELESDAEKGFKLINNLVETISQAAGTATDSDPEEVNAVKSIFSDIIDEASRQIEASVKENNIDPTMGDAFVHISETTRKGIAEAPNQTILTAILKPYVVILEDFASNGLQITAP